MAELIKTGDEPAHEKFPCEECGAALTYAPGKPVVQCEFCGTENAIEHDESPWADDALSEQSLRAALSNQLSEAVYEETQVIHCDACGADVEFDADTHAGEYQPCIICQGNGSLIKA